MSDYEDWIACPICGEETPDGADTCRHCGADLEAGPAEDWETEYPYGYSDEDDFDYDEFVEREFSDSGDQRTRLTRGPWGWLIVLIILALCFSLLWW